MENLMGWFDQNVTEWLDQHAIDWGLKIVVAIAIFVVGKILARVLSNVLVKAMRRSRMSDLLVSFLGNITYGLLLIAVVIAAVDSLGVNVTSFMAILGAAGLAVGLALKDSLGNFAAGVMIIIFRPFQIGDYITAGGTEGTVDEIGLFATMMHTGDNQRIIVPNSSIIGDNIINATTLPTRRIDLVIGIGYEDNIGLAKDTLKSILDADERVLDDPAPVIRVGELGDSSVNLQVRPWVKTEDYWPTRTELLEVIKVKLDDVGISIPFPQRDVHMHEVKAAS